MATSKKKTTEKKATKKKAAKKPAEPKPVVEEPAVETVDLPMPTFGRAVNLSKRRAAWHRWHLATGRPIPANWRRR